MFLPLVPLFVYSKFENSNGRVCETSSTSCNITTQIVNIIDNIVKELSNTGHDYTGNVCILIYMYIIINITTLKAPNLSLTA